MEQGGEVGSSTLRPVAAQTLSSDLELARAIAEGQEAKDAEQKADGLGRHRLDGSDINSLGVVTEPVTKIGAGNHELVELLATDGSGHQDLEEGVFNVSMAPYRL